MLMGFQKRAQIEKKTKKESLKEGKNMEEPSKRKITPTFSKDN
jgi:hypothetical protein